MMRLLSLRYRIGIPSVRVALSYGYHCFMVFYVQKVGTFCTRAPHLLLQMSTGHSRCGCFASRISSVIIRSLLLIGMGFIDALQGNVFYGIGPFVLLVCVIYLCKLHFRFRKQGISLSGSRWGRLIRRHRVDRESLRHPQAPS